MELTNELRNCECCGASYSTGKEYEDYWCKIPIPGKESKGLCEFCNPSNKKWYNHKPDHIKESCRQI